MRPLRQHVLTVLLITIMDYQGAIGTEMEKPIFAI